MASLHFRHKRSCALGDTYRAVEQEDGACTCEPTYYVMVRHYGKTHPHRAGKNRKAADRLLSKLQVTEDEHAFQPAKNIAFDKWADEWLALLENKAEGTIAVYRGTMNYAKALYGRKPVRQLTVHDVSNFNTYLKGLGTMGASTRAKHLTILGICLKSAKENDYASLTPALPKGEKPSSKPLCSESAYFENEELPVLFGKIPDGFWKTLFRLALATGLRVGEIQALTWGDVRWNNNLIAVTKQIAQNKVARPKGGKTRDVQVPAVVMKMLGKWSGECGHPTGDSVRVFPARFSGRPLDAETIRAKLYEAMDAAGIPSVGPKGAERSMHAFRHTYAKRALESGAAIFWLSRQLGHSSIKITVDTYGHWERAAGAAEAEKMASSVLAGV